MITAGSARWLGLCPVDNIYSCFCPLFSSKIHSVNGSEKGSLQTLQLPTSPLQLTPLHGVLTLLLCDALNLCCGVRVHLWTEKAATLETCLGELHRENVAIAPVCPLPLFPKAGHSGTYCITGLGEK